MAHNVNSSYFSSVVNLDGNYYRNCNFVNCVLEFRGEAPFQLDSCIFENCRWSLIDGAGATIAVMRGIYNMQPDGPKHVEEIMKWIRMPFSEDELKEQPN